MRVDELALALRARDALLARALYDELLAADPASIEPSTLSDEIALAIAASIVELIAARRQTNAPSWTQQIAPLQSAYTLVTVRLPEKLARLERETPPELRARNLIAPRDFLRSV